MMTVTPSTEARILAAAVDRFTTDGPEAVSLREVAKASGITPMAIYRHFADKRALMDAVLQAGFKLYEGYLSIDPGEMDALGVMRARAARIFDFAVEQPAYFETMFLSSRAHRDLIDPERLRAIHAPTFRIARKAVRQCRDSGFVHADNPDAVARDLLAYCIGFCAFQLNGALPMNLEQARAAYLEGFDRRLPTSTTPNRGSP